MSIVFDRRGEGAGEEGVSGGLDAVSVAHGDDHGRVAWRRREGVPWRARGDGAPRNRGLGR
jgi:hypothetical protein